MVRIFTARRMVVAATAALGTAALAAAVGRTIQSAATRSDERHLPPQGALIDVGGRRLHTLIMGREHGGPTVVFEAGLGCPLESWAWIQPQVAQLAPTLSYDRAGLGSSDDCKRPRTAALYTADLDRLLDAVDLPGPYVLVGHSVGGLLVRHYTAAFPDRVAGLVLVDSSHPDQLTRSTRQWLGIPLMRAQLRAARITSWLGIMRRTHRYLAAPGLQRLPEGDREFAAARMMSSKVNQAANKEFDGWLDSINDEVRESHFPQDIPVAVLTSGVVADDDAVHRELQAELSQLSLKGSHRVIDEADHLGLVMSDEYASNVVEAILDILAAVR